MLMFRPNQLEVGLKLKAQSALVNAVKAVFPTENKCRITLKVR